MKPCRSMDLRPYSEQVGAYMQRLGIAGEINFW